MSEMDSGRDSVRECPECGRDGHQAWVLGHWHCPMCELTFTDSGETDVPQI